MAWILVCLALVVCLGPIVMAQDMADDDRDLSAVSQEALDLVAGASDQAVLGAALFDYHCSACHGDTGLGLAEARVSFPAGHRDCVQCHRSNNPPQMDMAQIRHNYAFSVGVAPPVRGPEALGTFANSKVLFEYVRATMPRPFPGTLPDDEFWAIVAFMLEANGIDTGPGSLGPDRSIALDRP